LSLFGLPDPFLAIPGGCFYINPSRRVPVAPFSRFLGGTPPGRDSETPGNPGGVWSPRDLLGPGGLPPGPRDGDRAPARGVDVKPPPRRRPGPGTRVPGWLGGLPCPQGSPGKGLSALRALAGPGDLRIPDPDPAPGVVLHQPLAAGPCPRPEPPGSRRRSETGVPGPQAWASPGARCGSLDMSNRY